MNYKDYRRIAREKLAGDWGNAILVCFVAALLGGLIVGTSSFNLNINENAQWQENFGQISPAIIRMMTRIATFAGLLSLAQFVIGGVVRQGYAVFLLKQFRGQDHDVNDLFSQFDRFGDGFCLNLLQRLFIALWTLLFIIPGIVAAFSYAMAPFIMAENKEMTASEALRASKTLMNGHKMDLFLLTLSFIGWEILCAFTLGIGLLWLTPYMNATYAAFYHDITNRY